MCHMRALGYSCGHASFHHISSCRGTYSDPAGNSILCHANPSFILMVSESCTDCAYEEFREDWEQRIAEAQGKHAVACQMTFEVESDGASCGELGDGFYGADDTDGMGSDVSKAVREQQRAEEDLRRLREEYERESVLRWNPYVNGDGQSFQRNLHRSRKPSSKTARPSPLQNVRNLADMPDEVEEESDDSDAESSTSMSRSPSLLSDFSFSASDVSDELELSELYRPLSSPLSPKMWTSQEKPVSPVAIATESPLGTPTMEDEDALLPNYGF